MRRWPAAGFVTGPRAAPPPTRAPAPVRPLPSKEKLCSCTPAGHRGVQTDRATGGTPEVGDSAAGTQRSTALPRERFTRQGRPAHAGPALSSFPGPGTPHPSVSQLTEPHPFSPAPRPDRRTRLHGQPRFGGGSYRSGGPARRAPLPRPARRAFPGALGRRTVLRSGPSPSRGPGGRGLLSVGGDGGFGRGRPAGGRGGGCGGGAGAGRHRGDPQPERGRGPGGQGGW